MALRNYLEAAAEVEKRLLQNPPRIFQFVVEIDDAFQDVLPSITKHGPRALMLFLNARLLYSAAVRIGVSSHQAAMFPVLRTCMESACYGYLIVQDPELGSVWDARHDSDDAMRECRRRFSSAVSDAAKSTSTKVEGLSDWIVGLYQATIDSGAHPNQQSIYRTVSVNDAGDNWEVNLHAIMGEDSPVARWALLACAEIGLAAICVTAAALAERTSDVWERIQDLHHRKNSFELSLYD